MNHDIARAWEYHNRTKHSPESVRRNAHYLDWSNLPVPFKTYASLEAIPLPEPTPPSGVPALAAICAAGDLGRQAVSVAALSDVFRYSAGITRRRRHSGGEILFRAAACTGALYEIELYLVCGPLDDLEAGVYHLGPADLAARRLRSGDYRGLVAAAAAQESAIAHAPAILISTGTYWRNAWKYQARTYRHFGWDNGTMHANLLAVAGALGTPVKLVCGFVDAEINRLLDLDTDREVALAMVALGHAPAPAPASPGEIAPLDLETVPLSREEVGYPLMREMHAASSLTTPEQVAAWRDDPGAAALPALQDEPPVLDTIEEVILRRGSTRRFRQAPITRAQLLTVLDRSTRGVPADFGPVINDVYVVAHAVDGLDPGAYYYHRDARSLQCLRPGNFRREAAFLALEQDLAGDAAAAVFFLANLHHWLGRFGNRGYRVVQLEAGILGGRMYLASYAQRIGATGLTFYDDEVIQFFSPHAAGKSAIFLVALGHRA